MADLPQQKPELPRLERLKDGDSHVFISPTKKINSGQDLAFFLTSTAYRGLLVWLLQLNRSIFPAKDQSGAIHAARLDQPPGFSEIIRNLRALLADLRGLLLKAPPNTGPRRFGNVAFREWHKLAEEHSNELLNKYLAQVFEPWTQDNESLAKEEVKTYLLGSFGSPQRLDYGTGHELSFLAFLGCLWGLGAFEDGEERAIVIGVIQPYLDLVRELVLTYTLEPAGSHGVWGLDDHSFVPYIFGSAQLGPAIHESDRSSIPPQEGSLPSAPSPAKVTDKDLVAGWKDSNMYFSAIQFIYDVKRGPFWEHSPVLYDVSGIKDGWGKINKGMLKMYAAEVLGKFPVVQHFPFGSLFMWEQDADAERVQASMRAQQHQPAVSKDVPPVIGTAAPWARSSSSTAATELNNGMASLRAPWSGADAGMKPSSPAARRMGPPARQR